MADNYKTFISHSSIEENFVKEVVKKLGHDFVNVDMWSFEAGSELTEEIVNHINASNIFVLMLSDSALNSQWVLQEIKMIRARIIDGEDVIFMPFIVDNTICHNDSRFNDKNLVWIKRYLISTINSPSIVARIIKRRMRVAIWEQEPIIKERDKFFFGRDQDMNDLRLKLYGTLGNPKRCIIVSGLAHVGRKRLLKEFIWRHINILHEAYDPIRIVMTESDGIDRFVHQLNEIVCVYDNDSIFALMREPDKCLTIAVELLNKIAECKERVFVRDEKSVVLSNGMFAEWFVNLIKHRDLHPMIHLFIASRYTPMASAERNFPEVIVRQIKGLDKPNILALFNALAKNRKLSLSEMQTKVYTSKLSGYPRLVYDVIDCLADNDLRTASQQIPQIIKMFDNNLVDIINEISETPHAKDILVLLSKFEFISLELLEKVSPDDVSEALTLFRNYSLYESFGSVNQYIRLSPVMADYISRSRMTLPPDYVQQLRRITRKLLEDMDGKLTDLSSQLLGIKEVLKDRTVKAKEHFLIPSFILKVIIEEYKEHTEEHNQNVIDIVEMLLNNNLYGGYDEINRSIHYWYCCALCRKKDPKFLKEVDYFRNSNYSYNFLRGFYERHKKHYEKAEEYYMKALEQSRSASDREYISKAEHELVIVKMELEDYKNALELAEKSYEREKDNSYHIEAYFRCLVRSPHPDVSILSELIERMKRSYAEGKDNIKDTMEAEYAYYIENDFPKAIKKLKDVLMMGNNAKKSYANRALKQICKDSDSRNLYHAVMREVNKC